MRTLILIGLVLAAIVLARVIVVMRRDWKATNDEDVFTRTRRSRRRR